ncbi:MULTISPECIES: type II secretion system major pseudopilin GspG [Undibacterium]|uniref:Type II secretion system core protein G n=1 Tax=Undibacterium rivi TaxID=2828729 RepID=A0ABS5H641_9BURK|nr:type II secretion system major pseudopilin GspG [Undibacterium rivi]MBR7794040.1 type II secretion system major pseudopilin GspG [Undibacterium rivi]
MYRKQQLQTGLLKKHAGFTLLEMLVVMVIIGLLAGLVGPRIFGKVDTSKVQTAQTQIKMLESALNIMRLDVGQTPPQDQGLQWLVTAPQDPTLQSLWKGPYIEGSVPVDPWGNPYQYKTPGVDNKAFSVYSFGADGKAGGEGLNADIGLGANAAPATK